MPSVLSKNGRRRLTIYPPPNYDSNHRFREALTKIKPQFLTKIKPQFALELFTWIFKLLCVHTEVKIELKLSAVRDKQVLSQAERCPGHASTQSNCPAQYGVKLITVQNNAKSSWSLSGTKLGKDDRCPGQYWKCWAQSGTVLNESSWALSGRVLSQFDRCPGQQYCTVSRTERCPKSSK